MEAFAAAGGGEEVRARDGEEGTRHATGEEVARGLPPAAASSSTRAASRGATVAHDLLRDSQSVGVATRGNLAAPRARRKQLQLLHGALAGFLAAEFARLAAREPLDWGEQQRSNTFSERVGQAALVCVKSKAQLGEAVAGRCVAYCGRHRQQHQQHLDLHGCFCSTSQSANSGMRRWVAPNHRS
ncbi:hypothetical protein GQ600_8861 [Phytophthora cactorum]|nr:hypothetical protein GQ600_8861 [Phytophthora cactorum]